MLSLGSITRQIFQKYYNNENTIQKMCEAELEFINLHDYRKYGVFTTGNLEILIHIQLCQLFGCKTKITFRCFAKQKSIK